MSKQTERVELLAEKREILGKKVKRLRQEGKLPATMYGHSFAPVALQLDAHDVQPVLSHIGGSQLVSIKVRGTKVPEMALVREVQRHPIRGTLLHVDFYRVSMDERIRAEIPIVLAGESRIVVANEGILIQGIGSIEVECLPGDLVESFEVDISTLTKVDQILTVGELPVPSGVDVLTHADEMVVRINPAYEMVIEEEVEEVEVEVIEAERAEEAGEKPTAKAAEDDEG